VDGDKYEVLDGQQRITSIGRFIKGKFAAKDANDHEQYYSGMSEEQRKLILDKELLIYICEGEEQEMMKWFETINIAGVPLKLQEIRNAVYHGPFVTKAKEVFSNSQDANVQKWSTYVAGDVKRQDYLETALDWASNGNIEAYMSNHRNDDNIDELENNFNKVIDWVSDTFTDVHSEMRGLEWHRLYAVYGDNTYGPKVVAGKVKDLFTSYEVRKKKGIFEYILGGMKDPSLLEIRIFEPSTIKTAYAQQTTKAEEKGISNCPVCASVNNNNKDRIYKLSEMDADHVTAWSNGGATDISNCEMLCISHNRAKGNR
jgi:hypothetical protein